MNINNNYVIYKLSSNDNKYSYTGSTNNCIRRLKQHNKIIKGGAKYTCNKLKNNHYICDDDYYWKYKMIIILNNRFNKNLVLSYEWYIKKMCKFSKNMLLFNKLSLIDSTSYKFKTIKKLNPNIKFNVFFSVLNETYENSIFNFNFNNVNFFFINYFTNFIINQANTIGHLVF